MHRRLLLVAWACGVRVPAFAQPDAARPHQRISANELRSALATRFPMRLVVPALLEVELTTPRLRLLPATQQLRATVPAALSDLLKQQRYLCEMDWAFALRYESADRSVRARDLAIVGLRSPGLPADAAEAWQALLTDVIRASTGELILHRFTTRELALPDAMGFEPAQIRVEEDGIIIWFGPKVRQ